jgi:hypothetical protein
MLIKEAIIKILKQVYRALQVYYEEKKGFYDHVILRNKTGEGIFCKEPFWLSDLILKVVFFFLLFSLVWLLYDSYINLYNYLKMTTFLLLKENPRLIDDPLFIQVKKLYYMNDYFSIDIMFFLFVTTPIFILIKLYILEKAADDDHKNSFELTKVYCYLIMFFGVLYYLFVYNNYTSLGMRVNTANNIIYNNINVDFINSQNICNYLNKKSPYDYSFVYGKCNDIKNNIGISKLHAYIKSVTNDIQQNIAPMTNITIQKFKTLKDKNGKLYKDKILSAFFTFQLIKYYLDNDLTEEAKDFFSAYNLIYLKNVNLLRDKINPILYIRFNDIMVFTKNFEYSLSMANSFGDNKDIYNYIHSEFSRIQNIIQNVVVDIYNILKYKLLSVFAYYFLMFIILVIMIIIYIYNN